MYLYNPLGLHGLLGEFYLYGCRRLQNQIDRPVGRYYFTVVEDSEIINNLELA
jgi:hypothetical protein